MKVGVYVCECGINISATVDVEKVAEVAKDFPNVEVSRYYKYMCSDPGQELIKQDIDNLGLDRIVVASCSPRMHEPTFRAVVEDKGMNPYNLEMVNIREQNSWVHKDKEIGTEKAISLVRSGVLKATLLKPLTKKKVGVTPSALVIGGGIAGIQAALDIGNMGFETILVEKTPSIGGVMAQLDKTFPTLDCSACILTPKMVDVARHPKVELMTYSEIEKVEGFIGNFKVTVKKKARYVDINKCTACGDCVENCPVIELDEYNANMMTKKAIYIPFPQAVPQKYTIAKLEEYSPCKVTCPASNNAQGYVQLIGIGKYKEALEVIRDKNPFPSVCGRVCHHPCEEVCKRAEIDEPISIMQLKRFAVDYNRLHDEPHPEVTKTTKKEEIAIIGAGPSGLSCAIRLLEQGYPVTIYDEADIPGGIMTSCLPSYRLPPDLALYDINRLLDQGINLIKNTKVGKDISFEEIKNKYDAVFIGIGAQLPAVLEVEGSNVSGVLEGLTFLKDAKKGIKTPGFGEKLIIIGGGNVAMDCAKVALRMGAKEVNVVCLETRDLALKDRMPADVWEIEESEEEGVIFFNELGPKRILSKKGKVTGLETMICSSVYEEDGSFKPEFCGDPSPDIKGDTIIFAIGQKSDLTGFEEVETNPGGRTIKVNTITFETSVPGVFAGGDIVPGIPSVVNAIGTGAEAAISIDRFLRKVDIQEGRVRDITKIDFVRLDKEKRPRAKMKRAPVEERIKDFREIDLGYTEEEAVQEALRCISCSICSECMQCVETCEAEAIIHDQEAEYVELDIGAIVVATGFDNYDPSNKPEYGYGQTSNVITAIEFERLVSSSGPTEGHIEIDGKEPENVVFIQCVGSRDKEGHEYCSRVCCMYTAKQAHMVRDKLPNSKLTVYNTDVRAFGKGFEEFYNRVQAEDIDYRRRELDDSIQVVGNEKGVIVKAEGHPDIHADLVVLATGLVPREDSKELSRLLNINMSEDGYFLEAHPKLRPVDTFTDGVFLAGCCQSPKDIPDTVAQASSAASRACNILSQKELEIEATIAHVDESLCRGCGFCVESCPYSAIELKIINQYGYETEVASVNEALCKGCGSCAAACLNGAINHLGYTDHQILAQIKALGEK